MNTLQIKQQLQLKGRTIKLLCAKHNNLEVSQFASKTLHQGASALSELSATLRPHHRRDQVLFAFLVTRVGTNLNIFPFARTEFS